MPEKEIYIVITQTGTILSRVLKRITGAEYNHASVSLRPDLRLMYSFGRKNPYNPWWGGFVQESPEFGTFKRFSETRAIVLSVPVDAATYDEMERTLREMFQNRNDYHYDTVGLLLAAFNISYKRDRHFYCSDFVRDVLVRFGIEESGFFEPIVKPVHFLDIPDGKVIYKGRLRDYSLAAVKQQAS
ncbi:MAG: hypothetical protein J1F09_09645 [Oscillospiraceae bacterium]|nr:hypothetical protein [Oscillospiraceae bacterium]